MSKVSVVECKKRKQALEKALTVQIAELVNQFEIETGVNIQDIYLNFTDVSEIDRPDKYVFTSVTVRTQESD
ncbi:MULTISPECIES: hypothetical protein [Acinetobacter]|jgi:CxxC motif-containing protein|uniref:Uncharacterized protein n=1 Tax=Acinetobacter courvalinii TaxID=280147 RepID=N9NJE7_9GAMM|nr:MULTISPECIES: hypothetical protein [Acinetobacter]RSN84254.1 hypothetical protein EA770_01460 [Acinetobacter baumannii]ENX05781.1 hypothetical protein F898_02725 [Acinetobacter courvalinii]ENX37004.1 hypothetical protein F888_02340 [Acinetobacter courvalinii]KAB0658381.1 hypothetical protein F7P77_11805 [Acinetobacter courvalinii]MBJ9955696.1 hypothetical protein [Acinetobacter courvalinii]